LNKLDELNINQIHKLAKSLKGVLNISLTGGEPFLRNDIDKIIEIFYRQSKPLVVSIISNGSLPDAINDKIFKVMKRNKNLRLSVIISIDGPEKIHDKIRGRKGSYANAVRSVKILKNLQKRFANLNIGVVTTLNNLNRPYHKKFYEFLKNKLNVDSVQLNFMRGKPKELKNDKRDIGFYKNIADKTREDIYKRKVKGYSNFIGSGLYQAANIIFRQVIYKTARSEQFVLPCAAGRLNGVTYSNGDVYACEILESTRIGNLKDHDFDIRSLWKSDKAEKIRKFIYKTKCFCTHECQLTTSVLFSPQYFLKILHEFLRIKYYQFKEKFQ